MPSFRNKITIGVPAAALWAAMTDPACFLEVYPELVTTFDPEAPMQVGTRITIMRASSLDASGDVGEKLKLGQASRQVLLCTAIDAGRSFVLEGEHLFQGNVPFRMRISTELHPAPGGVRYEQRTRIRTLGPVSWLIAWLFCGPARKMQQAHLERMKGLVEEALAPAGVPEGRLT